MVNYTFSKNFKFKINIQIKKIINLNPSPNNIPKIIGGENIKKKIENKLNKKNDPLRKKFFLLVLLKFFKIFHSHSINLKNFSDNKNKYFINIINFYRLFLFIKLISPVSNKLYPLLQKDSKFYFLNLQRKLIPYIVIF